MNNRRTGAGERTVTGAARVAKGAAVVVPPITRAEHDVAMARTASS